jgi:hypothetical protein
VASRRPLVNQGSRALLRLRKIPRRVRSRGRCPATLAGAGYANTPRRISAAISAAIGRCGPP